MHFGVIDLHQNNSSWFILDRGNGTLPNIGAIATERDGRKKQNVCEAGLGQGPSDPPELPVPNCTNSTTNVAQSGAGVTVADIEPLPLCGEFGIETEPPGNRPMHGDQRPGGAR